MKQQWRCGKDRNSDLHCCAMCNFFMNKRCKIVSSLAPPPSAHRIKSTSFPDWEKFNYEKFLSSTVAALHPSLMRFVPVKLNCKTLHILIAEGGIGTMSEIMQKRIKITTTCSANTTIEALFAALAESILKYYKGISAFVYCYHLRHYLVHKYKRKQSNSSSWKKAKFPSFSRESFFKRTFKFYSERITFKCLGVFVTLWWMWAISPLICVTYKARSVVGRSQTNQVAWALWMCRLTESVSVNDESN